MYVLLITLIILVGLLVLLSVNENFQDSNNGYTNACNEINTKRLFLKQYIQGLRSPVQDLSGLLLSGINIKKENMNYQNKFTDDCMKNLTPACIGLASVDAGVFAALPGIDIFYQNLLIGGYDLDALLQQLNIYSKLLNCPNNTNNNEIDIDRDIGVVDTESLAYELESLSPYYLSPDVVQYLLRFLISKEQLNNLRFTSADYVNQTRTIMNSIKPYYTP